MMQPQQPNPYGPPVSNTVPVEVPQEKTPKTLIVAIVLLSLLCLAVLGFAILMTMQAQDYKTNVNQKIQAAIVVANEKQKKELDAAFAEQEKSPLKSYTSPAAYGAVKVVYPKTWSAQVTESPTGTNIDAFFFPNYVPALTGKTPFYLRIQVLSSSYVNELAKYKAMVTSGSLKATPFVADAVPSVTGTKLVGSFPPEKKGTIVLLPLRDKTIKIWTENDAAAKDFEEIILKQLSFSP